MERTSRSEYPRYKLNPTGTHATAKFPGEKMNERELLHGLNDRFAGFIEKVHHLEHQNHFLQREIEEIRGNQETSTAALEQEYAPELRDLRRLVRGLTQQKHQVEIERQNLENEASELKQKFDRESQSRAVAESDIMMMKRDMGDAHQAKLQLHLKAQALQDEIDFLKTNHEAEVSEIISQIQHSTQDHGASTMEFGKPELTVALREIRSQLEGSTLSDLRRAEETFLFQFAKLTEIAERKREALKESHREIQEYRRSLQARSTELDCVKGAREALEKQLREVEDHHHGDVIHYQDTIKKLENELIDAKFYMSGHLREYQDLLNVKMALDVEILSYRKLLEGEENHLSSISDTHLSLPHIYRQSPVYSLPRPGQRGALSRRAEPQYKFVEEIITETTREIETSEFEETETPLQETARAEGEESRDKGEGGKGKEGGEGCQDGREEDGEQVSRGQQNQVEPEGDGERGDQDRSLLGENAEDGGRGEVRGESEQAEADNTDKDNAETGRVSCGEREETNDAARAEREASLTPEKSEEVAAEGDDNGDAPAKSHRVGSKETNGGAQAKRPFQESSISGSQGSDRGGTESDDVAEAKGISLGSDTAAEKAELKTDLTREAADPAESKQSPLTPKRTEEDASSTETTPISQPSETVQVNMEKEPNGSKNISNDGSEKHHEELDDASNLTEFPQVEDKKQMVKSPAAVASTGSKATAGSTHQQIDPSSKEPKNPTDAESKDCGEVSGSQSQADVGTTKSAVGKVEDNSTSNLKGKLEGDLLNGGRGVKEQKEKPTKGEAQAEEKGGNVKEEKSSV